MRAENVRMKNFLKCHGVVATPKWISTGSLKRCWRLYDYAQDWTIELAEALNNLGFSDFNHKPLGLYSGNGGRFSVFVRGHEELLNA